MTDVSTATSTTTSTLTTTSTEFAPIATYYPACGSDNRVTSIDGRGIINGDVPNWYVTTQAASAYDCCVLCLQSQSCGATFYSNTVFDNFCALVNTAGTCSPTTQVNELITNPGTGYYVVSNGNCGRHGYAGR